MSRFLHHESCEVCGSKDNKAVFDDGHTFCFGCRTIAGGKPSMKSIHEQLSSSIPLNKEFPRDATDEIPTKPLLWLLQNRITYQKITTFGIKWSPFRKLLCWKVKAPSGNVIAWQGRCFGDNAKTKYISHGKLHEDICILYPDNYAGYSPLVLVEDYISAIRVSSHLPCMSLFGCTCSLEALQGVKERFRSIQVWLDADKLDNARKIAFKANMMGLGNQVIYTPKDPKEYSDQEIRSYLEVV